MTNLEKYNQAFAEVFAVDAAALHDGFSKDSVDGWDSVHQLNLITLVEESFGLLLETEEIMEFVSYKKGKDILGKYGVEI